MSRLIYGENEMAGALAIMAADILAAQPQEPVLIGIRRGGLVLSDRLAELISLKLGRPPAQGVIDINLYRDDWTRARALPAVGRTEINFSLDDLRVVLVDDVLFTGRTVRAALEALADFGRPARIELAVLVDRGHREMPIRADYAPFRLATSSAGQRVNVHFRGQSGRPADEVVLENE
ncbi:MAG: bifunctional pyr operon transcriptional regulator/uracil phosphoribosyltransferase PyrR [Candidatus Adiutrix sp.]|jgi:pyrimidine operon attenuation protein/uracil phosphoribosyltransferase|nr:bifunctional pyr operon transcriptional regulator/uracil phosphoribosyltransferase PyrR [Candidatus Adiutrix sp.]